MPGKNFKDKQKKAGVERKDSLKAQATKVVKEKGPKLSDDEIFKRDIPGMALLIVLYMFQGLPFGLFLNSIPLLFKQHLSYQEIGVITMCTMPYSFKVFWSPLVELYKIPGYPKRKSWVVPTQLIGSCILFFLSFEIEEMLNTKNVYKLLGCLIANTFIITCQDIAVDSWAVEMLHPINSSYASSAQSVGMKFGSLISSSFFLAMNDKEFCNKYIYATPQEQPAWTIPNFLFYWAFAQAAVTLWIAFFINEGKIWDDDEDEVEEITVMPNQVFAILKDIFFNKNLLYYFAFVLITGPSFQFNAKVSQLYLTDELKFSRASVSSIRLLSTPANLMCSVLSGYFASGRPFTFFYWISVLSLVLASYSILVNIRFFPTDQVEQQSTFNLVHYAANEVVNQLADVFWFTTSNAVIYKIVDKRISGIHITLLTSMTNWAQFVHKFYLFKLVDNFGIYNPQIVLSAIGIVVMVLMKDNFCALDDEPLENWKVSEEVIKSTQKSQSKTKKE